METSIKKAGRVPTQAHSMRGSCLPTRGLSVGRLVTILLCLCTGCGETVVDTPREQGRHEKEEGYLDFLSKKGDPVILPDDSVSYVRIKAKISNDKRLFVVDVEAKADPKLLPLNTLAFFTMYFFYDPDEITFVTSQGGVLGREYFGGTGVQQITDGHVVRIDYASTGVGTSGSPGYDLPKKWVLMQRVYFRLTGLTRDPWLSIRQRGLYLGFYDSPGNSNGRSTFFYSDVVVK